LDLYTHVIIVEIDEDQHRDYSNCENKRMMELSQDLGHRPIIFIRFNPDDYKDKNNNKITSCWGINSHGLSHIKKSKKDEWLYRLGVLRNKIIEYMTISEDVKTITNEYLFYDEE
jgi:hypothetical protein